jgi:hypothetical protein
MLSFLRVTSPEFWGVIHTANELVEAVEDEELLP